MSACALLLSLGALVAPGSHDAIDDLLDGVDGIASPGVPGGVCAFGPRAFVVATAANGVPVVAGAEAGEGRVLIFGHNGYLGAGAWSVADTGVLMRNAVRWLSGGKRKLLVATNGNEGLAQAFEDLGLRAEAGASLGDADCLVLDAGGALSPERIAELRAFVEDGGGLLMGATGWGWQQLNSGKRLERDLPGNRLLVPFGLAWTHETASDEEPVATAAPPAALSHAGRAFDAARGGEAPPAALARLRAALSALPDHEPLLIVPLRAWLESGDAPSGLVDHYGKRAWRPLGERWGPWWVVGPFAHGPGGKSVAAPVQGPEKELDRHARDGPGPDLGRSFRGRGGRVAWRPLAVDGDGRDVDVGEVRFRRVVAPAKETAGWAEDASAYLYRRVELDADAELRLLAGSDDGLRIWCNGELAADRPSSAGIAADEGEVVLPLLAGVNHLLVKVANGDGVWGFRLGRTESAITQQAVNDAIDRGVAWLMDHQQVDGSWTTRSEYGIGYTALAVYTLLESGVPRDHPAVQHGIACVRARPGRFTYATSCRVLALAAYDRDVASSELHEAVARLLDYQSGGGMYAYPIFPDGGARAVDLSNTLFAALALRAAAQTGVEIPPRVWKELAEGTLECWEHARAQKKQRREPGGFAYHPRGNPTGSMTTAGLGVVLICREALGKRLDRGLEAEIDAAVESGLAWIDRNLEWGENPGQNRWHYFFIYGVERVGSLLDVDVLGKVDWYWSGAEFLVGRQKPSGEWKAEDSDPVAAVDTSLALLFLNKATAPVSGARRGPARLVLSAEGDADDVHLRAVGRNPLDVWITGYGARVRDELAWPGAKEPRVERVRYVALRASDDRETVLAEVAGDPTLGSQRFEARVRIPEPGTWQLFARVDALEPPPDPALAPVGVELVSPRLEIDVPAPMDATVLDYPRDRDANLLKGNVASAEASTENGAETALLALDGRHDTRWRCAADDPAPSWRVELERPVSCDRIAFSHAMAQRKDGDQAQPARLQVILNDGEPLSLEVPPDPLTKAVLGFSVPRGISSLEVRVLEARNGALGAVSIGFSEVELTLLR